MSYPRKFVCIFNVTIHWRGDTFQDQIAASNVISDARCLELLDALLENVRAPTDTFSGLCNMQYFTRETAGKVFREQALPDDAGVYVHLYPGRE